MPEKYESKPCGNCGGTVYYRGAGCVTCVSRRTHESYHGRRREIARLKRERDELLAAIDAWEANPTTANEFAIKEAAAKARGAAMKSSNDCSCASPHVDCWSSRCRHDALKTLQTKRDQLLAENETMHELLLLALYHAQGAHSPVGQPIRQFLGMDQFDPMTEEQIAIAKARKL